MLLFLLTAREGRLSANPPRLSVIAQFQTRHAPRTRPAPSHSCASHSPPAAFPATKPATSRILYSGTNSRVAQAPERLLAARDGGLTYVRQDTPTWLEHALLGTEYELTPALRAEAEHHRDRDDFGYSR